MQTEYSTIQIRLEQRLKKQLTSILDKDGLSPADAVRLFFNYVAKEKEFPAQFKTPNAETEKAMKDAKLRRNLKSYNSAEDLFHNILQ